MNHVILGNDVAIKVLCATSPLFVLAMGLYAGAQWLVLPGNGAAVLARLAAPLPAGAQRAGRRQHHVDGGTGSRGAYAAVAGHHPDDPG